MHLVRRAAIFILPLLSLAALLYIFDWWSTHQKELQKAPIVASVEDVKIKDEIKYRLKTVNGLKAQSFDTQTKQNIKENKAFFTVVLDPTHGGDDAGSIGYQSAVESNLNLQFAFKLARALRMKGVKVYLTRMEDTNPSFETRIKESVKRAPNIFLSINCSFSDIKSLRGMEIYGYTPADAEEDKVAKGAQLTKTQDSMFVENKVSLAIKEELDLPYKSGLERKNLKLIELPPDIPTLALFIGYISNPDDVEKLENEKYVDKLTERLSNAIEKGLLKNFKVN